MRVSDRDNLILKRTIQNIEKMDGDTMDKEKKGQDLKKRNK